MSDLVPANADGQVIEGRYHVDQAAVIHRAPRVHAARPVAVAPCHSVHGRVLAATPL